MAEPLAPSPDGAACPACQRPRLPESAECPYCGVIYARYRPPRPAPPVALSRPAGPSAGTVVPPAAARPRLERAWFLRGFAQWLEAGRDPTLFWKSPLMSGLSPMAQQRVLTLAQRADPLTALAQAGFLPGLAATVAHEGLKHGRLPDALRLIAYADDRQHQLRSSYLMTLTAPLLFAAGLLLMGEAPMVLAGFGSLTALVPGVALGGAGLAIAASTLIQDSRHPIDLGLRRILAWVPAFASAYKWRAQASILAVLERAAATELPPPIAVGAARIAGDHPDVDRMFDQAQKNPALSAVPSMVFARWFSARERATLAHATELGRLPETVVPMRERRTRLVEMAQRVTSWSIIGLTLVLASVISVIRVASAYLRYAQDLGVQL